MAWQTAGSKALELRQRPKHGLDTSSGVAAAGSGLKHIRCRGSGRIGLKQIQWRRSRRIGL
jgi:hypothetical protein